MFMKGLTTLLNFIYLLFVLILMLFDSIQNFHIYMVLSILNCPLYRALIGVYLVKLFLVHFGI